MFNEFSATHKPLVQQELIRLFKYEQAAVSAGVYRGLLRNTALLVGRGGKRLRPLLCLLAYEGYGGTNREAILPVAVSQELIHAFLLMHDDIIDRDVVRWGGANITGMYFEKLSTIMPPRDAFHFAEAQALLAGDSCLTLANKLVSEADFEPQLVVQAIRLQQSALQQALAGETSDTLAPYQKLKPTEAQILAIYHHKTASYSFRLPLQLGALLAGASTKELALLGEIAEHIGIAFQLQDDLLGIFGDEQVTGKSALGDLREGKRTLLITKTLELANNQDRMVLKRMLGNTNVDRKTAEHAQDIMRRSGAVQYVQTLARQYSDTAKDLLKKTELQPQAKTYLQDLINSLDGRAA